MENKELLPSQIGCIELNDCAKIEELISVALSVLDGNKCKEYEVLSNGINVFPLTPLLEDAYMEGFKDAMCNDSKDFDIFIQSPIKFIQDTRCKKHLAKKTAILVLQTMKYTY